MAFSFGTPKTAAPGFTLTPTAPNTLVAPTAGAGDAKLQSKPLTNLFGAVPAATSAPAFAFGAPTASAPKTTPSLSFGFGPATSAPAQPLAFSISTNTPSGVASATPVLNFGLSTAAAAAPPTLSTTVSSGAPLQFNLPSSTSVATSQTTFTPLFPGTAITSSPATLASSLPSFSAATAATTAPLKLTASLAPASSVAPTLSLAPTSTPLSVAAVIPTTTTVAPPAAGSLTYAQLEDSINKWTIDLEEQGKFFINQAKQLNAWDSLLISNSDKILALNDTIEQVKQQQKQLDQELDFVTAQQNELEELSAPLEKQLMDIPVADQNRFQMYQLSEIVDSQLKQMSEDLKEIVEHLNESNKSEDISDPVIQVSRILNAHMNSLQWIDRNTSQICSHLDQISKMHEMHKQHLNL